MAISKVEPVAGINLTAEKEGGAYAPNPGSSSDRVFENAVLVIHQELIQNAATLLFEQGVAMKFKTTILIIGLLVIFATSSSQTFGQSTVSPQKRALIKELLEVTEAVKLAESTSQTMMTQMEQEFPRIMEMLLTQQAADEKLTDAQRKALLEDSGKSSLRMLKRFQERALATVNFAELLDTVSVELYDKYFTEEELKDMVAFYRTPTGKKTVQVMPKLVNDTIQKSNGIILPKIMSLLDELIKEEIKRIK